MFSPNGYVSFLKAYKVVKEHYEKSDLDLEHLFNFSFDTYGGERSANLAKVYSEREVLEKTLFQIIEGFDYYVCSEMGEVFQFDLPVYLNLVKMRELKGLYGFDEEYFDHHISWPDYEHIIDENLTKGADPWQATFGDFPNTSLNIYYSRETFLIDDTGYLDLNRYCNQMFFPEHYGYPFSHETIQKFNGWSLCLKSEDFQLIHQDTVKEIFFKIVFEAVFGLDTFDGFIGLGTVKRKYGRPPKKQVAAEAFLRHFEWDSKPNWKTVQKVLLEKEGLDVSPKTIKRGLTELRDD